MAKAKPGRKTIVTPEVIDKLEYAFSLGCTDVEACLHADISPATLYNHQDKNPEFLERKIKLKESPIFIARQSVINGMKRNPDLALKFLERRKKDEFGKQADTEINIHMPKPILGGGSKKIIEGEVTDAVHSDNSDQQALSS